jgi:hypothetical protein
MHTSVVDIFALGVEHRLMSRYDRLHLPVVGPCVLLQVATAWPLSRLRVCPIAWASWTGRARQTYVAAHFEAFFFVARVEQSINRLAWPHWLGSAQSCHKPLRAFDTRTAAVFSHPAQGKALSQHDPTLWGCMTSMGPSVKVTSLWSSVQRYSPSPPSLPTCSLTALTALPLHRPIIVRPSTSPLALDVTFVEAQTYHTVCLFWQANNFGRRRNARYASTESCRHHHVHNLSCSCNVQQPTVLT